MQYLISLLNSFLALDFLILNFHFKKRKWNIYIFEPLYPCFPYFSAAGFYVVTSFHWTQFPYNIDEGKEKEKFPARNTSTCAEFASSPHVCVDFHRNSSFRRHHKEPCLHCPSLSEVWGTVWVRPVMESVYFIVIFV